MFNFLDRVRIADESYIGGEDDINIYLKKRVFQDFDTKEMLEGYEILTIPNNKECDCWVSFIKKEFVKKLSDSEINLDKDKMYGTKLYNELKDERNFLRKLVMEKK